MKNLSQTEKIKKHLQSGKHITAIDALNICGCFRLAARINDLRKEGMAIESRPFRTNGGAVISEYYLKQPGSAF